MLTYEVCVGAGSGVRVGIRVRNGVRSVLRDGGGPSHSPDYPELPKGHERDVALAASSIRNKGSTAREYGGLGGGCSDTWL